MKVFIYFEVWQSPFRKFISETACDMELPNMDILNNNDNKIY